MAWHVERFSEENANLGGLAHTLGSAIFSLLTPALLDPSRARGPLQDAQTEKKVCASLPSYLRPCQ